tara:strand:+ start:11965 stop:12591 length:627 start_codon:yes stop_codon:yes gene_type:complete
MANEKFSDFTLKTNLADFDGLVGFDTGVDNLQISKENLGLHLPTRFILCAYSITPQGAGRSGMFWNGGVNSSGAGTSQDDGSLYVFQSFKINKIIQRWSGRNGVDLNAGSDALSYELCTLNPQSAGPPASWAGASNSPTVGNTTLVDNFGGVFNLTNADTGTWPYVIYTPGTPIACVADTMLTMVCTEVGTTPQQNAEMMFWLDCQYT